MPPTPTNNDLSNISRLIENPKSLNWNEPGVCGFVSMLTTNRKRVPSLHGWTILVLLEEGVIRECAEHGWMRERGDPHARIRAIGLAKSDPPAGYSSERRSLNC